MLSSLAAAFRSSVLQSAARDLLTLANGVFARPSRSLSAVFLPRSQDEKHVLVVRSSRQRSAIYRRSRTVCSLAHRALCPLSSSLAPKTKSMSWSFVRPDSGARFIDARERCVRSRIGDVGLAGQRPGQGDEGADAGSGAAGADVAIGCAIVEGRSRNVEMCPWRAVRHEFAQKGGGQ